MRRNRMTLKEIEKHKGKKNTQKWANNTPKTNPMTRVIDVSF